jgi:hypothetical protein
LLRLKACENRLKFQANLYSLGVVNVKTGKVKNSEPESTRQTHLKAAAEVLGVKQGFYRIKQWLKLVLEFERSPITARERPVWREVLQRVTSEGNTQKTTYEILKKLAEGVTLGLKDKE